MNLIIQKWFDEDLDAPVTGAVLVTPGVAALTLALFAPIVMVPIIPGTLGLTISVFAPAVTATANQLVTPGTLALTTTRFVPTVTATGDLVGTQFYTTAGTMRAMGRRRR